MIMFQNEEELLNIIQDKLNLIHEVVDGSISIDEFFEKYASFYFYYALDGHEFDDEEKLLFIKYSDKIHLFYTIETDIFSNICTDEDSIKEIYIKNNRYSRKDAIKKLKEFMSHV